jgi:hypothetical protein
LCLPQNVAIKRSRRSGRIKTQVDAQVERAGLKVPSSVQVKYTGDGTFATASVCIVKQGFGAGGGYGIDDDETTTEITAVRFTFWPVCIRKINTCVVGSELIVGVEAARCCMCDPEHSFGMTLSGRGQLIKAQRKDVRPNHVMPNTSVIERGTIQVNAGCSAVRHVPAKWAERDNMNEVRYGTSP